MAALAQGLARDKVSAMTVRLVSGWGRQIAEHVRRHHEDGKGQHHQHQDDDAFPRKMNLGRTADGRLRFFNHLEKAPTRNRERRVQRAGFEKGAAPKRVFFAPSRILRRGSRQHPGCGGRSRLEAADVHPQQISVAAGREARLDVGNELVRRGLVDQPPDLDRGPVVADEADHRTHVGEGHRLWSTLPYLRPRGLYILEDWAWAHWPGDTWQKSKAIPSSKPALSNLVFELCMLCASRPDIVSDIAVTTNTVVLRRGDAALTPGTFDIGQHYLCRDRWFKPIM